VILHSVRTVSDYLEIFKKSSFKGNRLLHSFRGNAQEVEKLLKYPVYFSFCHRIFNDQKSITYIPLEKILLETDDQSEVSIQQVYQKASDILGISLEDLKIQVRRNFLSFFNQLDDIGAADFINNFHT
jgi:TatD DNase family protein